MASIRGGISRIFRWIARFFTGLGGLVAATARRTVTANVPALSAALAFHALLSLAPLLLLVLTAASSVLGSHDARAHLIAAINSLGDPAAVAPLRTTVEMIVGARGSRLATAAGVLVMMYFASAVFHELGAALDRIWDVTPRPGLGGLLLQRLIALVIVPLAVAAGMALMAFSFMHALIAPILSQLLPPHAPARALSRGLVLSVLMALLLSSLYRYGPRASVRWREAAAGAALTALTFTAGNTALATMLRRNMLASLYGAAGAIVLLLLWIFYSAHILLIGACFTRELGVRFAPAAKRESAG
jgi:membrane protein